MRAAVLALLLVLVIAAPARATPQDLFGFGGRSPGLALTGVSYADDYEAVLLNPAGLARARRAGLHLGASVGVYSLQLDGLRVPLDSSRGSTIGATLPLPFHDMLEDRLVLGIGVFTPQQVLLRGQVIYPEIPQFSVMDRAQSLAIQVGFGFDFHDTDLDGLRVGIGISALATIIGDLQVRLDETSAFSSVVETQLLTVFAPIVGVQYDRDEWGGGLVYRHEVRAEMELNIVTMDLPVTLPVLTIGGLIQYDPAQLAGEVFWRPDPGVRLIANLTARFWSFYPGPFTNTSRSSLLPPATGFSDTVSARIAVEGTLQRGPVMLELRGGYALEPSPAPVARVAPRRTASGEIARDGAGEPLTGPIRILDNDRHILTAGIGVSCELGSNARLSLDAYGQAHILSARRHDIQASTEDLTMPGMQTDGVIMAGGWTLGLEF